MRLIDLRQADCHGSNAESSVLRYALSVAPLDSVVLSALYRYPCGISDGRSHAGLRYRAVPGGRTLWTLPGTWSVTLPMDLGRQVDGIGVGVDPDVLQSLHERSWIVISNGGFVAHAGGELIEQGLADSAADAVAIRVDPGLSACRERVRLTSDGELVGYRRLYQNFMEPAPAPRDWPHHLFVRGEAAAALWDGGLPFEFEVVVNRLRSCGLELRTFAVAGSLVDLRKADGLLAVCRKALEDGSFSCMSSTILRTQCTVVSGDDVQGTPPRFVGPLLSGRHVCIEPDAIVVGPSILCDNSTVRAGAVVDGSIVGTGCEVARDQIVRDMVVLTQQSSEGDRSGPRRNHHRPVLALTQDMVSFRVWPRFSYAGCFKRIADVVTAFVVLVLFAPIIPFIALAVKISSPGSVLFRHRRQGLHGRPFYCIKFRTMKTGADKLQDKLRFVSEVDGPQFKMVDDPRITTVGRFLRETYLDEIPQFWNVLRGDMSVVGPRPSPESENTLCPWWRDARLSVRPGITGLWQVCRTREPMRDFQEWIHYDTRYVRELSLRLDLWICWRTFGKMVVNFLRQF